VLPATSPSRNPLQEPEILDRNPLGGLLITLAGAQDAVPKA
jgi:hypothetical protein